MDISTKALYNSLRMSFLQNSETSFEKWKVEDYRALSLEELFLRLKKLEIVLDKPTFMAFADEFDSPEDFFDDLTADREFLGEEADQIYLLIFELWRRLASEKQSISILCDELDYQIFLYDSQDSRFSPETLEDTLTSFYSALEENVDQGAESCDVYEAIAEYLANDVQAFLLDYISELIESRDYDRATELIEQFYPFMPDKMWFDLLHARIVGAGDNLAGHELLRKIYLRHQQVPNLQFNFDILSYLVTLPDLELFREVALQSMHLIEEEEDFEDFAHIVAEFFVNREQHEKAELVERVLAKRKANNANGTLHKNDPDLDIVKQALR